MTDSCRFFNACALLKLVIDARVADGVKFPYNGRVFLTVGKDKALVIDNGIGDLKCMIEKTDR